MRKLALTYLICQLFVATLFGQNRITTEEYIETYREEAIRKMKEYGIPASITLAQGILESGSGNSRLARKANNHFGIKCHSDWKGKTFRMDDDARNECFRKYDDPADSYRDHSLFLTQRNRYAFLFEYEVTDYKSWARGLKKAGYATNPRYPQLLISLIERYDLAQYDSGIIPVKQLAANNKAIQSPPPPASGAALVKNLQPVAESSSGRPVYEINKAKVIVTKTGDTFYSLANEFDIYSWQLYKYNDRSKDYVLKADEIIYLEKKRKKADRKNSKHIVKAGESIRFISNVYGVRMSHLLKRNDLMENQLLEPGQVIKLR